MTTLTLGSISVYIPAWTTSVNLGSLPTTSFPTDCLASIWDLHQKGLGLPWSYNTQGCTVRTCCPSGNFYTENWAWMTSYYSPGLACPAKYRKCPPPPSPSTISSQPGETIAFCCPTSYTCPDTTPGPDHIYFACHTKLSTSTSVIILNNIFNQKTLSTQTHTIQTG
ncbi:hypothetical protein B0T25DRAFT_598025 [Lasiosphaeria hispida]|uniref:Uncharacterized protein n=1 Tax=Lasiosphaeria hispida TaxID=260671 RepID=A0AAJ0ML18_9PEZI|nr:hypothetical protein B0T25DRAFT_598025 [Lasiosphaeria hispida]